MSNRTCPGCGAIMRRGIRAQLVEQTGDVRGAIIVCGGCATRGVLIIAERVAPVATVEASEKNLRATLAPFVRTLEGRIKMIRNTPHYDRVPTDIQRARDDAYVEALEGVIHMFRTGRS